ncbi:MAG: hypothetical protein ACKVOW_16200, partial [Chitinophagaceae bacterium]
LNRSFTGGTVLKSTPTSWYLRRIITNLNDVVDFEYERKYPTISLTNGVDSYEAKTTNSVNQQTNYYATTDLQNISGIVQDPVYLKKIKYNDYLLSIDYSEAMLNKYPVLSGDSYDSYNQYTHYYSDWSFYQQADGAPVSPKEFKIDKITITNGGYNKQFNFEYYDGAIANRTFLKKLREGSLQNSLAHDFEYYGTIFNTDISPFSNSLFIDGYLTTKTDHWGFYNGRMPFPISEVPIVNGFYQKQWSGYVTANFINQYYLNRNPDATAMQIGALKKITYPTGGFTELIYEPHDYSKKLSLTTYLAISAGSTQTAGGLRIKEIKSYAFASDQPLTKKYYYLKDGASSGILNSGGINYLDSRQGTILISGSPQTFNYSYLYDNSQYPLLNTNGNHITYSRIEEQLENGSKKIYEYSNHDDNKFIDVGSFENIVTSGNALYYLQTNSRQFSRGNLLKEQAIAVGGTTFLVQNESDFENDQVAVNARAGIRTYSLKQKDIKMMSFHKKGFLGQDAIFQQANIWAPNISANMYYVHPYRPVEKRVTEIRQGVSINQREVYSYNTLNDKISQKDVFLLSNGQTRKTQYKYSVEKGTQPYLDMYQKNMINQLVEIKENKGFDQLSISQTDYKNWSNGALFLPEIYKSAIFNNTPEVDVSIQAYGDKGTIQQTISKSGVITSYAWGYKNEYPIAKIVNAQNSFSQFYVLDPKNASVDVPTNYSTFTDYNFKQYFTGDITCALTFKSSPGSNSTLKATITISDIASRSLCISTNNSCTNGNTNTYTFSNVPPGDYVLSVSLLENVSSPQGRIDFNYNGGTLSSTGVKEFFYQGFEEETTNIGIATPYAGKNYFIGNNGDYTVPFSIPNTRSYLVNYHYLQNGIWKNKTVNYSSNMLLSDGDAIDEVRVYPSDAFITTYTHQPLLGMTSETDPNGKTMIYEYDTLNRLKLIRDMEGNVLKTFEYKYQETQQ